MQPAENVAWRAALVVLHEARIDASRGKFALLPGLEEITPGVAEDLGPDENDIGNRSGAEFHDGLPTARNSKQVGTIPGLGQWLREPCELLGIDVTRAERDFLWAIDL